MDELRELQARARAAETAGQHAAALDLYQQLLSEPSGAASGHPWARAGELLLRLGREPEAADHLAGAVDRYADAGCGNVALALCQRLLRTDPSRIAYLRRFGEIAAELGYARDARHGLVEYAAQAETQGDAAGAVEALQTYLRRFPDDAAVRRRVEELGGPPAQPARAPVAELEPQRWDEPGTPLQPAAEPEPLDLLSSADGVEAGRAGWGTEESLVPTAADAVMEHDVLPLEGLETTGGESWDAPGSALDPPEEEAADDALPMLDATPPEGDLRADPGSPSDADALPLLGNDLEPDEPPAEDGAGAEEPADLPVLTAAPEPPDPVAALRERVGRDPADRAAWTGLVERLEERGDRPALVEALLGLARQQEAELDTAGARRTLARVLELDPAEPTAVRALASATPTARPPRDYVDLGELVLADDEDDLTRFQVSVGHPSGDEQGDLAEILDLFREKVSQGIDPRDVTSHYDLGLAFKEMGLFDDAIKQLQTALRAGAEPLPSLEVLGECFVGKGEFGMASRVLERASKLAGTTDADLVGIHYWLGRCREELDEGDASACYERVIAVDAGFRDARERLEALRAR